MTATLPALLDGLAASGGDRIAFRVDGREWRHGDLAEDSRRIAGGLARLGIGAGDRIALWLPNGAAFLALFFACARRRAVAFMVNTRFRHGEMADILARGRIRALALAPGFKGIGFLDILAECDPAALARIETLILDTDGDPPALPRGLAHARVVRLADLAGTPAETGAARPEDGCAVFTTSGTTRAPKFVLHPQRSIVAHAPVAAAAMGYSPATPVLQGLPFCGVYGFCQMMASLAAGAPATMLPFFDAEAAADAIARDGIVATNATDDMLERMLAADPAGRRIGRLRRVGYAAFKAPERRDLMAAYDAFGTRLHGLYGMSECQALFALQPLDDPPERRCRGGGRPVHAATGVRVRDPAGEALLPPGAAGLLEVSGPSLMAGYLDDPDATADALAPDGYLRTGDIGFLEPDGGFVYLARAGDVLRLGGFLVGPREIEAFLESDPAVDRAQVVAADGPEGPRAVGFVVLHPGAVLDEAALIARARDGLARYKAPARIVAVDAFPLTESANGMKIQKAKLREMAGRLLAAPVSE
ncbi:MAG: AMP-binding protein [Alphaproteobacteria bacterium]